MLARIIRLQTWKSEYTAEMCQDRSLDDLSQGLFAVADGAGTSSFPRLWADVVVNQFLQVPLMSDDPFEVEWWLRLAQDSYTARRPKLEMLVPIAREKESTQGSESTLATVRIARVDATSASAELLVFGDTCVFLGHPATQQVEVFPSLQFADFDRQPVCLPSNPGIFSRKFHRCNVLSSQVTAGDVLLLATDAVSRWIVGKGKGQKETIWESFTEVIQRKPGSDWEAFITQQRATRAMVDDDSTALLIELQADGFVFPAPTNDAECDVGPLGATTQHTPEVIAQRKASFEQARADQQRELEAIYFGDGKDLSDLLGSQVSREEMEYARQVADALRAVISASITYYKKSNFVPKLQEIWNKYKDLLQTEPCAEGIRTTLKANGVFNFPPPAPPETDPQMVQRLSDDAVTVTSIRPVEMPPSPGEPLQVASAEAEDIHPPPERSQPQLQSDAEEVNINGTLLTVGQVKSIKRLYVAYKIWEYKQELAAHPSDEARLEASRAALQQELDYPQVFNERTQEELKEDPLIQKAISSERGHNSALRAFTLNPELRLTYQAIVSKLGEHRYADLLNEQSLTPTDVWSILALLIRRWKWRAYVQSRSPRERRKRPGSGKFS